MAKIRALQTPDGVRWGAEAKCAGSSNIMIHFHHPDRRTARLDRYAWYLSHGPEARSVTARLAPAQVLASLTDEDLARLFRRSMPISSDHAGTAQPAPGRTQ